MDFLIASGSVPLANADVAPPTGTPQFATSGNPLGNPPIAPTVFPAYIFNLIMQELVNIVTAADITPSSTVTNQVLTAIKALIAAGPDGSGAVVSFNTRTGAVTLSSSDVTTALTFTPANVAGSASQTFAVAAAVAGSQAVPLSQMTSAISTETSRAEEEESTLSGAISSEAATRAAADTALSTAISNETSRAEGVEGALSSDMAATFSSFASFANQMEFGPGGSGTSEVSFTADVAGILIGIGSRNASTQAGGGSEINLVVNGASAATDNTSSSATLFAAIGVTAGAACTVALETSLGTAFSANALAIFIPTAVA
jgi:hypothetical protein